MFIAGALLAPCAPCGISGPQSRSVVGRPFSISGLPHVNKLRVGAGGATLWLRDGTLREIESVLVRPDRASNGSSPRFAPGLSSSGAAPASAATLHAAPAPASAAYLPPPPILMLLIYAASPIGIIHLCVTLL